MSRLTDAFGGMDKLSDIDQALVNYYEAQINYRKRSPRPREALLVLGKAFQAMLLDHQKMGHSQLLLITLPLRFSEAALEVE